jgi:hypothetical protein
MNARVVLNLGIATLLATTIVIAGGLIWLTAADPDKLMALTVRALSAIW